MTVIRGLILWPILNPSMDEVIAHWYIWTQSPVIYTIVKP